MGTYWTKHIFIHCIKVCYTYSNTDAKVLPITVPIFHWFQKQDSRDDFCLMKGKVWRCPCFVLMGWPELVLTSRSTRFFICLIIFISQFLFSHSLCIVCKPGRLCRMDREKGCRSILISIQIRIQHFRSGRIRIRILIQIFSWHKLKI